jgi:hypothetical protein
VTGRRGNSTGRRVPEKTTPSPRLSSISTLGRELSAVRLFRTAANRSLSEEVAGLRRSTIYRAVRVGFVTGLPTGRRWRPPTAGPTMVEIRLRAAEVRSPWPEERWRSATA